VTGPTATPSPVTGGLLLSQFAWPSVFVALVERVADDGERGREDQRRERAHHKARSDQLAGRRAQRRGAARGSEAEESGEQHRPAPIAVAEAPGGEDERGEGQVVAVDDPLQVARARAQLAR
jgi:hypothetical protein